MPWWRGNEPHVRQLYRFLGVWKIVPGGFLGTTELPLSRYEERGGRRDCAYSSSCGPWRRLRDRKFDQSYPDSNLDGDLDCHGDEQQHPLDGRRSEWDIHGAGMSIRPAQVFMALRIPCLHYTNSSTWNASLLKYNGKYFYATTETVALTNSSIATTYTVWFDNSTAYCVSPYLSVSELPTCPPP